MPRSALASLLVCSFALSLPACGGGKSEGADDESFSQAAACEQLETVASSWMDWKAAVGEFGHHYRYGVDEFVSAPDSTNAMPKYCVYTTTVEVEGDTVVSRSAVAVSTGAATCDPEWTETGAAIGSHTDGWAPDALTIETLYEDCCVTIMPDFSHFYANNYVGSYALLSYCGDDYCDDGGCSVGPLPDARVSSIEFL